MNKAVLQAKVKEIDATNHIVEILASTPDVDREGEVILPDAWVLDSFLKNPVLVNAHDYSDIANILGKCLDVWVDNEGLHARVQYLVGQGNPQADWAFALVQAGIAAYSVGFIELQSKPGEGRIKKVYTKVELLEISQVVVPANPNAVGARAASDEKLALALKYFREGVHSVHKKGAIPFRDYGIVEDRAAEWDAAAEVREADVEDLKKICAWYDEDNPDVKGSYKLPHHRVSDYKAVWRGVVAAMAALNGARGGVNIPEEDKQAVYEHLAKHYEQFGAEPPELRSYDSEEELLKACGWDWELPAAEVEQKAGRVISRANAQRIKEALEGIDEVKAQIRALSKALDSVKVPLEELLALAEPDVEEASMEDAVQKASKVQALLHKLLEIL